MHSVGTRIQQTLLGQAAVPQGPSILAPYGEVTLGEADYALVTITPHDQAEAVERFAQDKKLFAPSYLPLASSAPAAPRPVVLRGSSSWDPIAALRSGASRLSAHLAPITDSPFVRFLAGLPAPLPSLPAPRMADGSAPPAWALHPTLPHFATALPNGSVAINTISELSSAAPAPYTFSKGPGASPHAPLLVLSHELQRSVSDIVYSPAGGSLLAVACPDGIALWSYAAAAAAATAAAAAATASASSGRSAAQSSATGQPLRASFLGAKRSGLPALPAFREGSKGGLLGSLPVPNRPLAQAGSASQKMVDVAASSSLLSPGKALVPATKTGTSSAAAAAAAAAASLPCPGAAAAAAAPLPVLTWLPCPPAQGGLRRLTFSPCGSFLAVTCGAPRSCSSEEEKDDEDEGVAPFGAEILIWDVSRSVVAAVESSQAAAASADAAAALAASSAAEAAAAASKGPIVRSLVGVKSFLRSFFGPTGPVASLLAPGLLPTARPQVCAVLQRLSSCPVRRVVWSPKGTKVIVVLGTGQFLLGATEDWSFTGFSTWNGEPLCAAAWAADDETALLACERSSQVHVLTLRTLSAAAAAAAAAAAGNASSSGSDGAGAGNFETGDSGYTGVGGVQVLRAHARARGDYLSSASARVPGAGAKGGRVGAAISTVSALSAAVVGAVGRIAASSALYIDFAHARTSSGSGSGSGAGVGAMEGLCVRAIVWDPTNERLAATFAPAGPGGVRNAPRPPTKLSDVINDSDDSDDVSEDDASVGACRECVAIIHTPFGSHARPILLGFIRAPSPLAGAALARARTKGATFSSGAAQVENDFDDADGGLMGAGLSAALRGVTAETVSPRKRASFATPSSSNSRRGVDDVDGHDDEENDVFSPRKRTPHAARSPFSPGTGAGGAAVSLAPRSPTAPVGVAFHQTFRGGALLTVTWSSRLVTHHPLYFVGTGAHAAANAPRAESTGLIGAGPDDFLY